MIDKKCSNLTNLFNFKWKDIISNKDYLDLNVKDIQP